MAARLGNILYWAGCALAGFFVLLALIACFGGFFGGSMQQDEMLRYAVTCALRGFACWLVGRGFRYVLADA
jgi:hypothetical protein